MTPIDLPTLLRKIPYFAHITEDHLIHLSDRSIRRSFLQDEILFFEGDPSAGLWILEKGRVKAFKLSPDGQEYIMRFFGPGETFNDLAALDGASNAVSTMAITDVSAWVIPAEDLAEIIRADHELCYALLQGMVGRVRHLVGQVEDLALRPVTARLARFLLEQVEDPTLAHPAITRALIASHLATTPETISRSLRVLEKMGAIQFDRHNILLSDLDLLRELASVQP